MSLTPVQSRALALALLALLLGGLYLGAVRPYLERYHSSGAELVLLQERLAVLQRVVASRDAVSARLERVAALEARQQGYLTGETAPLASAELQEYVKQVVLASGGRLISTQAVPAELQAGLVPLTVKVAMRTDTEGLQRVIHALESGRPLLFLDNVVVRSLGAGRVRAGAATGESLDVRFDLTGYMRGPRR
jgi:general secretion pathway protein M